ncbi:MAG: SulP family inorganic anion transporter, partial [Gammaproteobacteria bacterium]|nr:SulP family inorganic anion transporter [Gammaproteobacteria bacterium]
MKFDTSNLRGDLFGGITAGVVALPLALALGVASGLGPMAGMWGAICVGFFAALFGGTPSQISGPTGPMVVVVAGLAASLASQPEMIFTAIILAGLLQIVFGALGFGQYIRLVPYPVVSGFMSGIGVIII